VEELSGGGIVGSYTLSCEKPDWTVLQRATVIVDRGKTKKVELCDCLRKFQG
jgi:hypothetical protein